MKTSASLKIRLMAGDEIAMGPGKAELLEAIDKTGSISEAARSMKMSYRRAWQLVDIMNRCFKKPLVEKTKGGSRGGGACLTEEGRKVLQHYLRLQKQAEQSIDKEIRALAGLLSTKR